MRTSVSGLCCQVSDAYLPVSRGWQQDGMIMSVTELTVSVSVEDGPGSARTVVRLVGEADITTRDLAQVLGQEARKKPRLLLVDMSGLTFADSAALQHILQAHRKLRADGCHLALVNPSQAVSRILHLSAIDQVIPVYGSVEQAAAQAR